MFKHWRCIPVLCTTAAFALAGASGDELATLKSQYAAEQASLQKESSKKLTEKQFNDLYTAYEKKLDAIGRKAVAFADSHQSPAGFEALQLAVKISQSDPAIAGDALTKMTPYIASDEFAKWSSGQGLDGLGILRFLPVDVKVKDQFLRKVIDGNPKAKPLAQYILGTQYCEQIGSLEYRHADQSKIDEARRTAHELLDSVRVNPTPLGGGSRKETIGDAAHRYLFELDHLQIGMEAPDIEATDENGNEFKLSDYKGKVVLLDFWGFW